MYKVFVFLAIVAAVSAVNFGLGAPLLSKVIYQSVKYTHIRPEVTVYQPEYKFKTVPDLPIRVKVAQPYNTALVSRNFVAAPQYGGYPGAGNRVFRFDN